MPRASYVEDIEERRWEDRGFRPHVPGPPVLYDCPFCDRQLASPTALRDHVSLSHPLDRPSLLVRGQRVEDETIIRARLSTDDLATVNCEKVECRVDGAAWRSTTIGALARRLSTLDHAYVELRLVHVRKPNEGRSERSCVLRIDVPDPRSLRAVDEAFQTHLTVEPLDINAVRRFTEACDRHRDAGDYADGLAVYVVGVMTKDQDRASGITLPYQDYKPKLQFALEHLKHFRRRLARTAAACIRFNLNDLSPTDGPSGIERLDAAMVMLRALAGQAPLGRPSYGRGGTSAHGGGFPIDAGTHEVLEFSKVAAGTLPPTATALDRVARLIASGSTSDYDRMKLRALLAHVYLGVSNPAAAAPQLRALSNDHHFGRWAETELERIGES